MSQFANERQLFSYTGLTPSEHSSGQATRKGHITKQGNSHLCAILIELAWRALRKDPALAQHYHQLRARAGGKRAIVVVARKLIGRIRAAFRKGELYLLVD
jgi:transposase